MNSLRFLGAAFALPAPAEALALACGSSSDASNDRSDGGASGSSGSTGASGTIGKVGNGLSSTPCGSPGVTCTKQQAVSAHVRLPTKSTDYALDLDGDEPGGKPLRPAHELVQQLWRQPAAGGVHRRLDGSAAAILLPAIAVNLTAMIAANPTSMSTMTIKSLFDSGHCTNLDGTMATANDSKIDGCEVSNNSVIRSVLAPDVRLFDDSGQFKASATGTKNAMSVGIALTLVGATF